MMLDLAFLPFLFLDKDRFRKFLYGKAGAHRQKEYSTGIKGIEYRVLSNIWITHPKLMEFVFSQIQWVFKILPEYISTINGLGSTLQKTINTVDLENAGYLINHYNIPCVPGQTING